MPRPLCSIKKYRLPLLAALLAAMLLSTTLAVAQTPGQSRTWTDASGKYKVEATLTTIEGDKVTLLRADGRKVVVPLDRLSKADQDYVRTAATTPATATPATGQAAAPDKLPIDLAWVADHFVLGGVYRPSKMAKSQLAQDIQEMFPVVKDHKRWGIDLDQIDWAVVLIGPNPAVLDANGSIDIAALGQLAADKRIEVATILISQQPLDRQAIKDSGQLADLAESTLDGKVYWTARTADHLGSEFLFYDDRTLLVGMIPGQLQKMISAKRPPGKLAAIFQQLDLSHAVAFAAVPFRIPVLDGDEDAGSLYKLMRKMDHAIGYVDMDKAVKLALQVTALDPAQTQQIKQSVEAAVGFGKLIAMTTLQDTLKDYNGDITPLTSLVSDTLNSFQASVDGNAAHFSIATPDDTFDRAVKSFPIALALVLRSAGNAPQPQDSP